ncbi:MAG: glycosyltransferase [Armatimonadetes bacterium]|nr:glycosyltransferase [Armatimonadota bacterium]
MEFAVIENGVDLQQFSPSPDSPVRDAPVVLFVSRLIERKGLHFLLAALARMKDRVPRFQLVVAGDGPLRAQLEAQANSLGLGDRVRWLGNVPHDRLPDVYRSADIFVLPSLSEGMANVALEAAASGLPLVLTDVPGTAELLVHGRNGFVVAPADVESLANAIERLLLDPHLRRRMGQASREVVRYLALFEQAISEWRATK